MGFLTSMLIQLTVLKKRTRSPIPSQTHLLQNRNPQKWENQTDQRPFSPVKGELEFYPAKYLSFKGDAQWCFYDDEFPSYNSKMSLSDNRGDRLFVEYRYTRDFIKSITTDLSLKITDYLTAYGGYERNIIDDKRIKTSVGIKYQAQCWSVGLQHLWYVLHTKSRFENVVNDGLINKSMEVFLPKVQVRSKRRDRKAMITVPLFPGYLFVKTDLSPHNHLEIVKTTGAVRLIGTKDGPVTVPRTAIESLKIMVEGNNQVSTGYRLKKGDPVIVIAGRGPWAICKYRGK
jgi:hypothetical protein